MHAQVHISVDCVISKLTLFFSHAVYVPVSSIEPKTDPSSQDWVTGYALEDGNFYYKAKSEL